MILALVLLAVAALAALAVWRPGVFVLGAVVSAPLQAYRRPPPDAIGSVGLPQANLSIFRICVLLAGFGVAVHVVREWRRGRDPWSALRPVGPIVVVAAAAGVWIWYESWRSLWSLGSTLASAHAFFLLAVIVLAAAFVLHLVSERAALTAAAASAVLPLGFAVYQVLAPGDPVEKSTKELPFVGLLDYDPASDQLRAGAAGEDQFRPASFLSDPNFLAIFAVGTVILADPAGWATERWQRRALNALRAVAALVVVLTLSRTGLIVLAAYGLLRYGPGAFAWVRARVRSPRLVVATVTVALGLAALGSVVAFQAARSASGSTESHIQTIRDAVDLWAQFPVYGAGLGNYGWAFGQAPDRSSAQSFPFTILAELGIIGFLLVLAVVWGPAVRLSRDNPWLRVAPLGVVFLVGIWFYDYALALDVCAVWLALLLAAGTAGMLRPGRRSAVALEPAPIFSERPT